MVGESERIALELGLTWSSGPAGKLASAGRLSGPMRPGGVPWRLRSYSNNE
jgi:hypothetical protein